MKITDLPQQQLSIIDRCFHASETFVEFAKEEVEQSIPDRFEEQVRRYPDRLAVKTRTDELTYDELNKAANRVAHSILKEIGDGQEQVVILLEQSSAAIVAILGALKAGKIYVPLDRSLPVDRLKYILGNSSAGLILTNSQNVTSVGNLTKDKSQVINIDHLNPALLNEDPRSPISPGNPASITYTSGSTGEPKGVVHSHRNILHFAMNSANYFHISKEDRLILLSSYSLHAGTHVIFPTLCNGASLYPLDLKEEGLNHASDWMNQQGITIYFSVPTVFRQIASSIKGDEKIPTVRLVELAGEQVDHRDVEFFNRHFSKDCIFVNRLGATETDGYSMWYMDQESLNEGSVVPGGYPIRDKEVLLIGDDGKEIGRDGVGEIAVRSPFVALGYWQLPDLTDAVFQPDPNCGEKRVFLTGDLGQRLPDGSLLHLGRKDFQVKIRGYRVEVAETELALIAHPSVNDAVAIANENWRGEKQLVAFLVGDLNNVPSDYELRRFLRPKLPDYMIPSAFIRMGSLPKLPNGKIDRNALPRPGHGRPDLETPFVGPRSVIEEVLADIWAPVTLLGFIALPSGASELHARRAVTADP